MRKILCQKVRINTTAKSLNVVKSRKLKTIIRLCWLFYFIVYKKGAYTLDDEKVCTLHTYRDGIYRQLT